MDTGIKGKIALVTAASLGIGKASAEALVAEGCKVAICSRSKENLLETAKEIKLKYGVDVLWSVCDLNKLSDIESTFKAVYGQLGNVDILINNCGGPMPGLFEELDEKDWDDAYEQVLLSVVRFTKLILPGMMANNWGRIINMTSLP